MAKGCLDHIFDLILVLLILVILFIESCFFFPLLLYMMWFGCGASLIQGNVGLIFTKGDLKEVREEVAKYKVCWIILTNIVCVRARARDFFFLHCCVPKMVR